ncbi:MAG: hypothetical protein KIS92_17745 [Planctomycetota bacterium]|nr:hypothetical protein [Planctomycetota bacterium]
MADTQTWNEIARSFADLEGLAAREVADWGAVRTWCEAILPRLRSLTQEEAAAAAQAGVPNLERIHARLTEHPLIEEAAAPVVLFGRGREEEVLAAWMGQFQANVRAVGGFARNDRKIYREWMMGWIEGEGAHFPFYRAEHTRDAVKEIYKLAGLLSSRRALIRVAPRTCLLRDGGGDGLRNWRCFGEGYFGRVGEDLRVYGAGNTVWLDRDFEGGLIAFDFQPMALEGAGSGALFAFPAVPCDARGYAISAGPMDQYNYGLDTYHVSLCRGNSGMTNLRRTCEGLRMLSTVQPDPCRPLDRRYRVELLQHGRSFQVHVDGQLVHAYVDAGVYGTPRVRGRFGLRLFSAARADMRLGRVEAWALAQG